MLHLNHSGIMVLIAIICVLGATFAISNPAIGVVMNQDILAEQMGAGGNAVT